MNKTKEIEVIVNRFAGFAQSQILRDKLIKEISALFEGMYEEEFLEWFTGENSPVAILYGNQKERFASADKSYTISELYKFWRENIKK